MKKEIIPHSISLEIAGSLPPGSVEALAGFYQLVRTSERFLWIGMIKSIDDLGRHRLKFCLLEKINDTRDSAEHNSGGVSVVPAFDKLVLALWPDFRANLYFASEIEYAPDQVPQLLKEYNSRESKHDQLIWEQVLV
ncbi:MAG: hypothetical protein A2694_02350 [Candidatus Blackburnbacteria bacterium RIFCSPHIGHO2_01_FULL_40_17]|nr:MAG: hypothetical protein A2694_02350 [Candidatus Blackburnbacteria bacterium RIFCSPHIGHO2_01_FULL_40_17]OGY15722.1 MAG: hypothetical protein A3I52_01510 [Candidatus Blackburnbacteria bacterium RIFCSPLOWO2_02_FULL_40_10]